MTYTGAGECVGFNVRITFNELDSDQITSFRSTHVPSKMT
jgi:hypothetical protein